MKIKLLNDPILREPTMPVTIDELESIQLMIPDMTKIMNEQGGLALAANQVGVLKRFFIMKDGENVLVVINPEITEIGPLSPFNEGCLSIPGVTAETKRAKQLKFKFKDEFFNDVEALHTGVSAVAIQHEVDHLDGKLYIDQLTPAKRMLTMAEHKKFLNRRGGRR